MVTWSIVRVLLFCLRNNVGGITVNTVDPEKHLYFFWIPFIRVRYLVHSTPQPRFTFFTTFTCNHLLGKGKRIITVSRANRAAVCKAWDISEKKASFVNVIYNCVDRAGGGVHRSADGSATRDIITMGHLVGYKNPGTWLKTAITITRQFTDVRFIWLGNGELFEEYKKKAGPGEKILFPGLADDPYPYLDKAAIYYQPSLHETHGIAVLEAMSCHLPCVVSETGGLPESVTDGFNGFLVPPVDADSHVAALKKLILDPELCREFGSNGYQQYLERFTFDKFCAEMDRLYLQ
jgi:glycosyltransferase involved in cell wall biosynthesis